MKICHACGQPVPERTGTLTASEELHQGVTVLMSEKQLPYDRKLSQFTRKYPEIWQRHIQESVQG